MQKTLLTGLNIFTCTSSEETRTYEIFKQGSRMQSEHRKISGCVDQYGTFWERNRESNFIHSCLEKKMPWNKPNQRSERPLQWKLQIAGERNSKKTLGALMGWKSYQWEVDVLLKRSADPAPFSLNFEPFFAKTEKKKNIQWCQHSWESKEFQGNQSNPARRSIVEVLLWLQAIYPTEPLSPKCHDTNKNRRPSKGDYRGTSQPTQSPEFWQRLQKYT